jgi:O-methyltransferase
MPHNNGTCLSCEWKRRTSASRVECSVRVAIDDDARNSPNTVIPISAVGANVVVVPSGKGVDIIKRGEKGECPIERIKYPNANNPDAPKPSYPAPLPQPTPYFDWPANIKWLAERARPGEIGVGQIIQRMISDRPSFEELRKIGAVLFWEFGQANTALNVMKWALGRECNCGDNAEHLDKLYPLSVNTIGGSGSGVIRQNAKIATEVAERDEPTRGFEETFRSIAPFTIVDKSRCLEIWQAAKLVNQRNIPGAFMELGTFRGGTAMLMRASAPASDREVFAFDTFFGIPEFTAGIDIYGVGQWAADEGTQQRLVDAGVIPVCGIFPGTFDGRYPDMQFALAHFDGDNYVSCQKFIELIWPRMSAGGIVIFDDCGDPNCPGVARAISEANLPCSPTMNGYQAVFTKGS